MSLDLTLSDFRTAQALLDGRILTTPLVATTSLVTPTGRSILLKAENLQRSGSFKIRGAPYSGQEIIDDFKQKYLPGGWTEDTLINFTKHNFEEYYPERFQEDAQAACSTGQLTRIRSVGNVEPFPYAFVHREKITLPIFGRNWTNDPFGFAALLFVTAEQSLLTFR